jgi:hypothetical protein
MSKEVLAGNSCLLLSRQFTAFLSACLPRDCDWIPPDQTKPNQTRVTQYQPPLHQRHLSRTSFLTHPRFLTSDTENPIEFDRQ